MKKEEFLVKFQDILQCDDPIEEATVLTELEEWDSLAFMALIVFFNSNFHQEINFDALASCKQASDVINLSQGKITS